MKYVWKDASGHFEGARNENRFRNVVVIMGFIIFHHVYSTSIHEWLLDKCSLRWKVSNLLDPFCSEKFSFNFILPPNRNVPDQRAFECGTVGELVVNLSAAGGSERLLTMPNLECTTWAFRGECALRMLGGCWTIELILVTENDDHLSRMFIYAATWITYSCGIVTDHYIGQNVL